HRYGWRSLPNRITSDLLNKLKEIVSVDQPSSLIDKAYVLDDNFIESVYVLRPIDPEKREEWKIMEKDLTTILRRASDICLENKTITQSERNEFHISVTAKEIIRALENNAIDHQRMVSFFREIEDIDQLDARLKSKLADTDNETEVLLNEIKSNIREKLPRENQFTYRVNWKNDSHRINYLIKFQNDFYNVIKQQIDYYMTQVRTKDVLYDEILEHAIQCQTLNERYFPRDEILEKVRAFVLSDGSQPCIIYGKLGSGKSSIMAQIAIKVLEWFPNSSSVSIIIRFLGATPLSSDIRRPLISIIQQICTIYHLTLMTPVQDSTGIEELKEILQNLFTQIPLNEKLILLFDSIDQLQVKDYNCEKWLPVYYPMNIKCILSTIPMIVEGSGEQKVEYKILDGLTSLFSDSILIEIKEFDRDQAKKVISSWLERDHRRLSSIQMTWLQAKLEPHISNRHDPEPTPLFLSLIYQITRSWHSFTNKSDRDFLRIQTTQDAISYLYNQLSRKHGEILFKRAMTYLRLSGGLSESELEDILSADDQVLQSVFTHYLPPTNVFRLPSTLWIRIRNDMHKYLIEKEIDNTLIIYFYHRSFQQQSILNINQEKSIETIRCAYFAGPIGNFPNLSDQLFKIQSKSLIKKMDGATSLVVNRCLTKQRPYILNENGKESVFNMRRLNQLCLNLDSCRLEPCFLYDYNFMWAFLHCYKMSDRFGADSSYPEIRFLLTQYKSCSTIVNKYPKNFAFEILSRLSSFIDILPDFTYHLFQECQNNCMFRILDNGNTRVLNTMMNTYKIGVINALCLGYSTLYVLLQEKILVFRFYPRDWLGKIFEYKLPSNQFPSIKFGTTDICFYSCQSILIFQKFYHQFVLQLNFNHIIHVDFFYMERLLVCTKDNQSIDIWHCVNKTLVEQYSFDVPIVECSTIERYMGVTIRVTLENGLIHYLIARDNQGKICFQLIATLTQKLADRNIFLNFNTDVYYCEKQSYIYLYHFGRAENDRLEKIDNLPLLNSMINRQNFFTDRHESALIWLANGSVVVFHSCGQYFLIPGEYHELYTKCQSKRNFISCLNRNQSRIDIYEWKLHESVHTYRLLAKLQLDEQIFHWACQIDAEWGFNVYCTLANGELRKYNVTMMTYLPIQTILQISIDRFEVQGDFVIALDKTKCILNVFTFDKRLSLVEQIQMPFMITQLAMNTSYLLVSNFNNTLFIYSISSTPVLFYQTNEFQYHSVKVYSIGLLFLIIDAATNQLFQIDTEHSFKLQNIAHFNFSCQSLLSTITVDRKKLFILADDYSVLAMWDVEKKAMELIFISLDNNIKIRKISGLQSVLVFYDNNQQVYWWDIERKQIIRTLDYDPCKTNANCRTHFTEDGKYLFEISQKESLLLMYSVNDNQLLEKIFIDSLLPHIEVFKDRIILCSDNELILLCINERDSSSSWIHDTIDSKRRCALLEQANWIDCHKDEQWITTNSICLYGNH
ncbi:unnamed protein product, partial [Adineta steineri]